MSLCGPSNDNVAAAATGATAGKKPASSSPTSTSKTSTAPVKAWDAWDRYLSARKSPIAPGPAEQKTFNDIAISISQCAATYKPKFAQFVEPPPPQIQLHHLDAVSLPSLDQLPTDLHQKLEVLGVATLKGVLKLDGELDYANVAHTTSDINAALSITGSVVQTGAERTAVVVMVATETEREASWSRLDGLMLHWGCSTAQGGPWAMPPPGWSAVPAKSRDAGGASQCAFERRALGGQESAFVLVLQLPLRGVLKSGGLVFVLKGEASKTDRWLKDSTNNKDFFLDLAQFPTTKL
uniref:Uncharacterized protein n=1 Tax=Dunaliella tertiolecta TaxID=3047 RepID=A0A7S3QKU3_DUNTE|mmetsp:Transcript_1312/g.3147  ORF Transcript_1312/g.3147 Transcript_1312/m.3147 type:complete len:295 (-) Transcript_1312:427-1311(-)